MKITSLSDASSRVGEIVNLMGVVVEVGLLRKSGGTDYVYTLNIIDERYRGEGFPVNLFAKNMDALPSVKSVGDVLILTYVKINLYNVNQVSGSFDMKLGLSMFALFDGKLSDHRPYLVHPVSHAMHFSSLISPVSRLREWFDDTKLIAGRETNLCLISEIEEEKCIDLICKVLHVYQESQEKWVMCVWDATDLPALNGDVVLFNEMESHFPEELNIPTFGSVFNIYVPCLKFDIDLVRQDRWIRLRRVKCSAPSSSWRGDLAAQSKIRFLSDTDSTVIQRIGYYNERLSTLCINSAIANQSPLYLTNTNESSFSKEDEPEMSPNVHSDTQGVLDPKMKRKRCQKRPSKKQRIRRQKQKQLIQSIPQVKIEHVYREANQAADELANQAVKIQTNTTSQDTKIWCNMCPEFLLNINHADTLGTKFPRNVKL